MDAGGSAFDSEIWCDGMVLNQTYKRPSSLCQSVTARLTSPFAMAEFKNALSLIRLTVQAERKSSIMNGSPRWLPLLYGCSDF